MKQSRWGWFWGKLPEKSETFDLKKAAVELGGEGEHPSSEIDKAILAIDGEPIEDKSKVPSTIVNMGGAGAGAAGKDDKGFLRRVFGYFKPEENKVVPTLSLSQEAPSPFGSSNQLDV